MHLEKPLLFPQRKGFLMLMSFLVLFILLRLVLHYQSYQQFISKPFYYTYVHVLSSYEKTKYSKRYHVLKLRSEEGFTFYTTSHKKENVNTQRLRVQLFPDASISFLDYLGTFYVKSRIKKQELLPPTIKNTLLLWVENQHSDKHLSDFYKAIFFATPLPASLRESIALLGVSHLVALSGFHLGILWLLVYGLIHFFYRPLQQKFFPYRFALLDVGSVVVILLGLYVWFVDAPPSLLRSYLMMTIGWIVLVLGIELLSFTFLSFVILLLLSFFPVLLVSIGFWFSVAGVFYIFLLLRYTQHLHAWTISLVIIPVGIFGLMLPIVHSIFALTSPYQLLSIILSLVFILFYPLAMLLHLLGIGDVLDIGLKWLFTLPSSSQEYYLPLWSLFIYIGVSLWAIWSKLGFILTLSLSFGYAGYLFIYS